VFKKLGQAGHPPKHEDRGGPFSGFAFFLPPKEDFFSFEEGCAFAECALVVEKDSWESLLSQMTVSITSSGHKPSLLHKFFSSSS
jgi:hypothetical protein